MMLRLLLIVILISAGLGTPAASAAPENPPKDLPALPQGQEWRLIWNDEFDGKSIDAAKWEIIGDVPRRGAFWVKDDAYLDGKGCLVLRTKKDGDRHTSGAVRTRGKFEHTYGYWEARCAFHSQPGHWPAFWLYPAAGTGAVGNGGRDGTEIDIMEKPWREDKIQHALHWDGYEKDHQSRHQEIMQAGLSEGFHTFAVWWTPEEYIFYVDGKETWRNRDDGVCRVPVYAKLTEEIGEWAGDIAAATLPDYFLVDYVRVYETAPLPEKQP